MMTFHHEIPLRNLDLLCFHIDEVFTHEVVVLLNTRIGLVSVDHKTAFGFGDMDAIKESGAPKRFAIRDVDCQSILDVAVLALRSAVRFSSHGSDWQIWVV
jgi:hypothetical protein